MSDAYATLLKEASALRRDIVAMTRRAEAAEKLLGAERKTIDELRAYLAYPQNEALQKLAAAEKRATEARGHVAQLEEALMSSKDHAETLKRQYATERDSLRARCEELEKAGGRLAAVVEYGPTGAPSAQALGLWGRALGASRLSEPTP